MRGNSSCWSEDDHIIGPDEEDGDKMEDGAADDLLGDVGHDGEDNRHEVSIVAPADDQRYEDHREKLDKAEIV